MIRICKVIPNHLSSNFVNSWNLKPQAHFVSEHTKYPTYIMIIGLINTRNIVETSPCLPIFMEKKRNKSMTTKKVRKGIFPNIFFGKR